MIKYFCDLCGEEVNEIERHCFLLSSLDDVHNWYKKSCICNTCRDEIKKFIDNNLDKKVDDEY